MKNWEKPPKLEFCSWILLCFAMWCLCEHDTVISLGGFQFISVLHSFPASFFSFARFLRVIFLAGKNWEKFVRCYSKSQWYRSVFPFFLSFVRSFPVFPKSPWYPRWRPSTKNISQIFSCWFQKTWPNFTMCKFCCARVYARSLLRILGHFCRFRRFGGL